MTRRSISVLLLAFALMVASPRRADAHWWDWLQELSGPGPSQTRGNLLFTTCFGDGLNQIRARAVTSKRPCLFMDIHRFENMDDDNFPSHVDANMYDFGPTWELWDDGEIEVGTGLGFIRFDSNGVTTTRTTLTIVRVLVEPFAILLPPSTSSNRFLRNLPHVFKAYVRESVFLGSLDASDFGVPIGTGPGQSSFAARNEKVTSMGFIIDLGELVFRR